MRAKRTDANLPDLVQVARQMGFRVYVRNDPLGDLDVQLCGLHEAWEVKTMKGKHTDLQKKMRSAGWVIRTVRSVDDVIQARAEMTRNAAAIQKQRMGD